MAKTIVITQPTFLPWMGYFDLVAQSDVFVILDSVQFEKQSWQSRNRIRTPNGEVLWLSVPVKQQPLETIVKDIQIASNPPLWRKKQLKTIYANLQKAPCISEVRRIVGSVFDKNHSNLADMNIDFIKILSRELGIERHFVRSSELSVKGKREELLLNLCKYFECDRYYSNAGSAVYLEKSRSAFSENGILLEFQQFEHPIYEQQGAGFISHLSVIDAIAAVGVDRLKGWLVER